MAQVDSSLDVLRGFAAAALTAAAAAAPAGAAAAAVLGVRSPGTESVGEKREGGVFAASD